MINTIIQKATGFLLRPVETFRKSKDDPFRDVIAYYIISLIFNCVLILLLTGGSQIILIQKGLAHEGGLLINSFFLFFTNDLFRTLVVGSLGLIIAAIVFHLYAYTATGWNAGIKKTLMAVMYGFSPYFIISWLAIPLSWFLSLFGLTVSFFLLIIAAWVSKTIICGIRELNGISAGPDVAGGKERVDTSPVIVTEKSTSLVALIKNVLKKATQFLRHPAEMFRNSKNDTPREVATYYLTLLALNLVLTGIIALLAGEIKPEVFTNPDISISLKVITAVLFISPTRTLVAGTIGLIVIGLLFHVLVFIAGGRTGIFTTFKVVIYSLTPVLLTGWLFELFLDSFVWFSYLKGDAALVVSIIAVLIGFVYIIAIPLWTLEFLYRGIVEIHGLSSDHALFVTGFTAVVLFIVGIFLVFLFIAATWMAGSLVVPHKLAVADFGGSSANAQEMQKCFLNKYGDPALYSGPPRLLEPMVSDGIADNLPTDKVTAFSKDTPSVYAWAFYEGFQKGDKVTMLWTFNGRQYATLTKPVAGNYGIVYGQFDKPLSDRPLGTHMITISGNGAKASAMFNIIDGQTETTLMPCQVRETGFTSVQPQYSNDQAVAETQKTPVNKVSKTLCPSGYTDLISDPKNCGICDAICQDDAVCSGGICITCSHGWIPCRGTTSHCVNLSNDGHNCGECGKQCGPMANCRNGICKCVLFDQEYCNDRCVSLKSNYNCGECGNICTEGSRCVYGVCLPV